MVERKYSSDSAISQTGRAFISRGTDKIDTNPKIVNSSRKYFGAKWHEVQPSGLRRSDIERISLLELSELRTVFIYRKK